MSDMKEDSGRYKKDLKELPVKLKLDLYVEVIIASLIEEGKLDASKLYIRPKGIFSRSYQKDLSKVEVLSDKETEESSVFFDINREGLYDMLPEGIFHTNFRKPGLIDTQKSIQELRRHQEEEKNARKFFLPLEQEFYRQRILIEIEEQKSLIGLSEAIVAELISNFWNIPLLLNYYQALCMVYMLPIAHRIAGNLKLTERCLGILLQTPVQLIIKKPVDEQLSLDENRLGNFSLGDNIFLGDVFSKETPSVLVRVGPDNNDFVFGFLPQGKRLGYLELFFDYFMPAELDWDLEIIVSPEQEIFKLGDHHEKGLLGYTTVI